MQEYSFEIKHRPWTKYQNCDALSRRSYSEHANCESVEDNSFTGEIIEISLIFPRDNDNHILLINESLIEREQSDKQYFDLSQIKEEQKQCPFFKDLYIFLKDGILPENVKRAKTIPYEANQYEMVHDTLFHIFHPRSKNKSVTEVILKQLAVPQSLRNDVLKSYHDSLAGGCHLRVQRTYTAIKQKYFTPGMYQNVYDYITSCDVCQRVKRDTTSRNAPLHPLPKEGLFQRWHMGILAGLPKRQKG